MWLSSGRSTLARPPRSSFTSVFAANSLPSASTNPSSVSATRVLRGSGTHSATWSRLSIFMGRPKIPRSGGWKLRGLRAHADRRELRRVLLRLGADHVHQRVDQRQVREGLREVAQVATRVGLELLGVQEE